MFPSIKNHLNTKRHTCSPRSEFCLFCTFPSLSNELIACSCCSGDHACMKERMETQRDKGLKDGRGSEDEQEERDREGESERAAHCADRWQPRCIAAQAHAIAVNHGRASNTHASTVDTSQYTQAGREGGVGGWGTHRQDAGSHCVLKDCGAG